MKKLFISISAAFVFLLSCIIPFTASADNVGTLLDSFFAESNIIRNDDQYYYICFCHSYESFGAIMYYDTVIQITKDCELIETENGFKVQGTQNSVMVYYDKRRDGGSWQQRGYIVWFSVSDTNQVIYENSAGNYVGANRTTTDYFDTMGSFAHPYIEVEVFPELCENFDYTVEYEGSQLPINCIQVDVINNTGYNYQYAVIIQPKNASLSYGLPPNTNNFTMFWGSSGITYALIKDEWIQYQMDINIDNFIGSTNMGLSPVVNCNTPSAWHFVSHHDTAREQIYYEQMQLKKGVDYTFKVLGFNITRDAPSQFTDDLACTTTQNIELLYSQDFSVVSDTKYDPDSVANGAYSFDNTATIGSQFDKVKGYVDTDGNVVIRDNNGLSNTSGNIGSNSSFNSLMMQSSSFLSLCKNVFTYFPDWVKILLSGGLIAIILVAIWRKI